MGGSAIGGWSVKLEALVSGGVGWWDDAVTIIISKRRLSFPDDVRIWMPGAR